LWVYDDYSCLSISSIRCFSSRVSFSSSISLEFPLRVSISFFMSILSPYLSDLLCGVSRGASNGDGNVGRKSGIKRLMIGLHLAYSSFRSQAGCKVHLFRARVEGRLHCYKFHESVRPGFHRWQQHPESTVISRLHCITRILQGEAGIFFPNIYVSYGTQANDLNETESKAPIGDNTQQEREWKIQPGYEALSSIIDFSYLIADDRNGSGGMIDDYKNGKIYETKISKSSLLAK